MATSPDAAPFTPSPDGSPTDAGDPDAAPIVCPDPLPAPEGLLSSPADLPRASCQPGAMAGIDPDGMWYFTLADGGFFSSGGPVRIDACDGDLRATSGFVTSQEGYASHTDDDLFWRFEMSFPSFQSVFAFTVCGTDGSGNLVGHGQRCFQPTGMDPFCTDFVVEKFEPFGRIPGEAVSEGFDLINAWSGPDDAPWPTTLTTNVRVVDDVAYLSRLEDGLRIVDINDPMNPVDLGHFPAVSDSNNDLKIVDGPGNTRYVLLASDVNGVLSVDVTDPTAPTLASTFSTQAPSNGVHTLFTETIGQTTYAYLVDGVGPELGIFDVTDPANPVRAGGYTLADPQGAIHDLSVQNGRAYLNATTGGMVVIDTQPAPQSPTLVGQFQPQVPEYSHSSWPTIAGGRPVAVHGDEGYAAHIKIVDADPASGEFMTVIGEYRTRDEVSAHNIMAFGDRAYMAYYQDGVRVLDISDPTNPQQIAYYNTWDSSISRAAFFEGAMGIDLDLANNIMYVADTQQGLVILRMTN